MAQPGCCVSQLGAPGQCRVAAPGPLSSAGPRPCASLASAGCSRRLLQPLGQPRAFAAAPRRRLGGFSSVVRADAGEAGIEGYSLPLPERKVLTRKAKRRIVREGPREQDLRDESGRIVKEVLPDPEDTRPPSWRGTPRITFGEFIRAVRDGSAADVQIWTDRDPTWWPPPGIWESFPGKRALVTFKDGRVGWTDIPIPELERLASAELIESTTSTVPYTFHQAPGREGYTKLDLGLIAIAGGVFIFICIYLGLIRKGGIPTDQIQAMEFGQSKAKSRMDGRTGVRFADVAGLGPVIDELQEVVAFLKDPKRFNTVGARPPRGLLLEGGPGTGKTLVAKAIAGEAGVPFYSMTGSEFVEIIVGVGAARVRDLFKRARVNAPCIVFVDEIDAIGMKRAPSSVRGNEEREQTLNQLLTEMDGFTADTGVIFVAATNRADLLDPALLRPGRFDRKVTVHRPNEAARMEALRIHTRKSAVSGDVDFDRLSRDLAGFSGAEIANLVNEAALFALRRGGEEITMADFDSARDRLLLGTPRRPLPADSLERKRLAAHEAGHAVVAALLRRQTGRLEVVERVSIAARGDEWSRTIFERGADDDYAFATRARLLERIQYLLAGRASEEVVLREPPSSYAVGDIQDATTLARRLICNYGMAANEAGLPTFTYKTQFAGGQSLWQRLSAGAALLDNAQGAAPQWDRKAGGRQLQETEAAVDAILRAAHEQNVQLLTRHRAAVAAVQQRLLDKDNVYGTEIEEILNAHPASEGAVAAAGAK